METNNEVKRTQGKWEVECKELGVYTIHTEEIDIAEVYGLDMPDEEGEVNAEFICEAVNNYDKIKEDNEALIVALKNLCKIAARETANLIAWDGAIPLDASIDRAKKAILKAESK